MKTPVFYFHMGISVDPVNSYGAIKLSQGYIPQNMKERIKRSL